MTQIGFIGLGIMGRPMARNLVTAGFDVLGYDHHQENIDSLVAVGGRGADSVKAAAVNADVVVTMLPDALNVRDAALGDNGFYAQTAPGLLHIDCSTIAPDAARAVAAEADRWGIAAIDAPVSGGEAGAFSASLSIMVGGAAEHVARARTVLEAVGTTIVHVGPTGAGQMVKAANQLLVAGTIELVAEALVLLRAYGVDERAAVQVLAGGLAGNAILDRKAAAMMAHDFRPGFRVDLHHKDMGIVTSAARAAGVALPLGDHVAGLIGSLRAQGYGHLDHSALLLLVERLSGLPLEL